RSSKHESFIRTTLSSLGPHNCHNRNGDREFLTAFRSARKFCRHSGKRDQRFKCGRLRWKIFSD
ncbi:MAG TPA: hypothetical protein PK992_17245, partial [Planctomycetaceae bacterium]|nr:hypothetical protein [Planctomycetaceae bacterium]